MIEIGRLCYKIAGREAGKPCVIIDVVNGNTVIIDGLVRRKKCNIKHLEYTSIVLPVKKNAQTSEVVDALLKNKIISEVPKKGAPRAAKPRPVKEKAVKEKLVVKKKEEPKKEEKHEKKEEHAEKKEEKHEKKEEKHEKKEAAKKKKEPKKEKSKPKKSKK